jgi:hypothetical protein
MQLTRVGHHWLCARRHDRIATDPDRRIREAIGLVFRRFRELASVRQVAAVAQAGAHRAAGAGP